MSGNISRHQVFMTLLGLSWQPGTRYVELPDRKINIGSKYPVVSVQYKRYFGKLFGSDSRSGQWKLSVRDDLPVKLAGLFRYRVGVGGFTGDQNAQVPDRMHFNGNISSFATEYLNSFQLLPLYQYSNTSHFYALAHLEHNFNGFLTNKIPVIRKLNFYLVTGANAFYLRQGNTNYAEIFVGLDNILKQFRIDFVQSYRDGKPWQSGFRLGLTRFSGPRGDDWP